MDTREAFIQLNLIPGLGSATIQRLLTAFPSPERIFRADPLILREILGRQGRQETIEQILRGREGSAALREMERADEGKVRIITLIDSDYPEVLKSLSDPPPVLYLKGTILSEDAAAVAVVGTRHATPYGLAIARQFACRFAHAGLTVVSGLAEGIDGAAHEGALEGGGRTLAVLGHGLNHLFPSQHKTLAERVVDSGALLSEFPMDLPPGKRQFPQRNRVIAGLSLGVVVIEAPFRSGALITAKEALDQGREIFSVPGPVSSPASRGTHQLIKEGAMLVEEPDEVIEELKIPLRDKVDKWEEPREPRVIAPRADLSQEESVLFEAIPVAGAAMTETLLKATALNPSTLLSLLTNLEIKGMIRQIPGHGYSRLFSS